MVQAPQTWALGVGRGWAPLGMGGHVAGTHGRGWHAACILSAGAGLAVNFR
jgi:hypothetical protein